MDPGNAKALYRRGISYLNIEELNQAKIDLLNAYQKEPTDRNIQISLDELKKKKLKLKEKEKEMSKKMIGELNYPEVKASETKPENQSKIQRLISTANNAIANII